MVDLIARAAGHLGLAPEGLAEALAEALARLDARIARQLDTITGHPAFRALEGAWRGLEWFIHETSEDPLLRVRVLNMARDELGPAADGGPARRWRQAPLARKLYFAPLRPEGVPFALVILDTAIEGGPAEMALLGNLARLSAACQAPLVANAGNGLFWGEDTAEFFAGGLFGEGQILAQRDPDWKALRKAPESAFVTLCLPKIRIRTEARPSAPPAWICAAFALGACIARSSSTYGLPGRCTGIEEGRFALDDAADPPVEHPIGDRRQADLARVGFTAVWWRVDTRVSAFLSGASLHDPPRHPDERQTAAARLRAQLPYLLPACRLGHYVMKMAAGWSGPQTGPQTDAGSFEAHVRAWLDALVEPNFRDRRADQRAAKPLRHAEFHLSPGSSIARLAIGLDHPTEIDDLTVDLEIPLLFPPH